MIVVSFLVPFQPVQAEKNALKPLSQGEMRTISGINGLITDNTNYSGDDSLMSSSVQLTSFLTVRSDTSGVILPFDRFWLEDLFRNREDELRDLYPVYQSRKNRDSLFTSQRRDSLLAESFFNLNDMDVFLGEVPAAFRDSPGF
jgi:hypothetical protein